MKFSKFIIIPIIVAALAFTIQVVDQLISGLMPIDGNKGFGWIAFVAWPLYFVAGLNAAGGRKVLYGFVFGIATAIAIIEVGGLLSTYLGFFAFPTAVFLVVIPCICLERVPPFDFIPALFCGAAIFFGMITYVPGATYVNAAITELTYGVIGVVYGWLTVFLRGKYESSVNVNAVTAESS